MSGSGDKERGYAYDANFIYNRPTLRYQSNEDCDTSLAIVKLAVDKMARWGHNITYYHDRDALPGGNVFTEFFKAVKMSRFTIVVITKGFVNDSWGKYKSQAAFAKLLEKEKSNRFIAFYMNIDKQHIPDELCISLALEFDDNWRTDLQEWNKLEKLLFPVSRPVQDTGRDPYPKTHNPEQQNVVVTSRQNYSGYQNMTGVPPENAFQRNPLTGHQDTNPPDPTILRGSDLATDSSDQTQSLNQVSQQRGDNPQSFGFSVNNEQNTDTRENIYQREQSNNVTSFSQEAPGRPENMAETSQNPVNVQREESTDTNPKDLVDSNDGNVMSSLDQHDVEADTQESTDQVQSQINIKHGKTCPWFDDDTTSDQQVTYDQLVREKDESLNQQQSAPGLNPAPSLNPESMQNEGLSYSNDTQSIEVKRKEGKSSTEASANNNSDASLPSQMYSLVTSNRFKFVIDSVMRVANAYTKCDQI